MDVPTPTDHLPDRVADPVLQRMFAAAPYGILLADPAARIVGVNRRLAEMFGYGEAELIGHPIETLLPQRLRESHVAVRDAFAAQPSVRPMGEGRDLTGLRKDRVEFPIEVALSPIAADGQNLICATVVDITERKRTERRLREANAQLEEFTHVASHDLRSPLRGILTLIDFIREDYGDTAPEPVINNLQRMRLRVATMERLIEDLLTYARAGRRTGRVETVDLAAIVDDILALEVPPPTAVIVRDIAIPPFEGPRVPITTVLRNLISNAIKHHHDPAAMSLIIRAHLEDDAYLFIVADDGPGIPIAAQARVFRLFQTVSSSIRKGAGLGLSVVQRLVESHGGTVQLISSDRRKGTTVRVRWPRFARSDHLA